MASTPDPSDHYFSAEPDVASRRREVDLVLPDVTLRLVTDRGVFAVDAVDPGTKFLLAEAPPPAPGTSRIVDVGCGYGPIAVALARRRPDVEVWAVDVNRRALGLTAENAAAAGVTVATMTPEEVPDGTVDEIWSNPPIRIGKRALHELLTSWIDRLAPGGRAVLVVHRNLGSDSLARWMREQGWEVERLGSRQGYRILEVRPVHPDRPVRPDHGS